MKNGGGFCLCSKYAVSHNSLGTQHKAESHSIAHVLPRSALNTTGTIVKGHRDDKPSFQETFGGGSRTRTDISEWINNEEKI
ncbi:hypothetical protein E2C01_025099 [Portunus trituberculatus]|uniref:Uncharacterized protein n=1 Tax=Portunus trituberculatus TaxID=210409 RepID=A0A5B7EC98_PORTR|nr:hypothetical protein [Portunus trituberculatus]